MSQNLLSAAVVIGTLRVKGGLFHLKLQPDSFRFSSYLHCAGHLNLFRFHDDICQDERKSRLHCISNMAFYLKLEISCPGSIDIFILLFIKN